MTFTLLNDGIPGYKSASVHPGENGKSFAAWKAEKLNTLFANQGTRGEPRIQAETVADGEEQWPK